MNRKSIDDNRSNKLLYDPNQRRLQRLGAFSMNENTEYEDEDVENTEEEQPQEVQNNVSEANALDEQNTNQQQEGQDETQQNTSSLRNTALTAARNARNIAAQKAKQVVSKVASKVAMRIVTFILANPWILGILAIVVFLLLIIIMMGAGESSANSSLNSSCDTSSDEANLVTFVGALEGTTSMCNGGSGYLAEDIGDDAISAGAGITNAAVSGATSFIDENNYGSYFHFNGSNYYMNLGDCIPTEVLDKMKIYVLENNYASTIDSISEKYGVTLTQYQKDAITSFNYNVGPGYTEDLISAYASGGYEGLWNEMKQYIYSSGGVWSGLLSRRKAEFALFVTGDYTDQGLFYSRDNENYDYYDSEGVMAREAICEPIGDGMLTTIDGYQARLTRPLRTNSYFYDQSSAGQLAYTDFEGECSWYAGHRAREILATMGSSKEWNSMPNGGQYCTTPVEVTSGTFQTSNDPASPRPGSLISWNDPGDYGHVAVVEEVYEDGSILVSEGYISLGIVSGRSELNSYMNSMGTRSGRKYNCEGNNSGCFHTITLTPDQIRNYNGQSVICYIYLLD